MMHRQDFRPDRIVRFTGKEGSDAKGLMDFLVENLRDAKRNGVKILLKYGHVRLNGHITKQFDAPVDAESEVEVNLDRPFAVLNNPRLSIVYEDDDIIVVNKGYGLLSVGTGSTAKEVTAYSILKDYVKAQNPGNKIFVVHRLDRDTSGLMMFAKSVEAQEAMQHNWNNMVLSRRYVAVVEGVMNEQSGAVKSQLGETRQYEVYSARGGMEGKPALTYYKVLSSGGGYSLVEFSLETGRKNQIRVHAKDLGHPIVGDRKYGAKSSPIRRLALHARTLRFAHPISRRDMNFELPVPSRFMGLVGRR